MLSGLQLNATFCTLCTHLTLLFNWCWHYHNVVNVWIFHLGAIGTLSHFYSFIWTLWGKDSKRPKNFSHTEWLQFWATRVNQQDNFFLFDASDFHREFQRHLPMHTNNMYKIILFCQVLYQRVLGEACFGRPLPRQMEYPIICLVSN